MAKILIVDDSKVMVKSLQKMFEGLGHEVVGAAYDGDEGCEQYEALKPDLVTMDINMPKMDGMTASRQILSKDPDAKIVVISSVDNPEFRYHVVEGSGVIDYLVKPIKAEGLEQKLKEMLP